MKKLAVAVISLALVASTAASAKPRKHHRQHHRHHAVKAQPQPVSPLAALFGATVAEPRSERRQRRQRGAAQEATSPAAIFAGAAAIGGDLVSRARAHLGQTAAQVGVRRNLWCGAFLNKIAGGGTGSDLAKSWLAKPRTGPRVGAIAVMGRGRGGHVGVVSGFDGAGNPIIISGNHNRRVGESVYPKGRVIAYVAP